MALPVIFANLPLNEDYLASVSKNIMASNLASGKGVVSGLSISAGPGLILNVAAGVFTAQIQFSVPSAFTLTVPASYSGLVWVQAPATGTVPDALFQNSDPGSTYVCVGYVAASGSAITGVDASQAQQYGSKAVKAELGSAQPTAVGGALSVAGVHAAQGGFGVVSKAFTSADVTLTSTEGAAELLILTGTPGTALNLIVPTVAGKPYDVVNQTDSAITVKGATGTGVTVAAGKSAHMNQFGGNVVRLGPDV